LTIWSDSLEIKLKLILKSKEYITTTDDLLFYWSLFRIVVIFKRIKTLVFL